MANLLKIYINDPTAGGTDGTVASENGAGTSPIQGNLVVTDSAGAEVAVKCALRLDSGYKTKDTTVLKFVDTNGADFTSSYYKLAKDASYANADTALANATWLDTISYTESLGATNTIFWVKLGAAAGTTPMNDTSVLLRHDETVEKA